MTNMRYAQEDNVTQVTRQDWISISTALSPTLHNILLHIQLQFKGYFFYFGTYIQFQLQVDFFSSSGRTLWFSFCRASLLFLLLLLLWLDNDKITPVYFVWPSLKSLRETLKWYKLHNFLKCQQIILDHFPSCVIFIFMLKALPGTFHSSWCCISFPHRENQVGSCHKPEHLQKVRFIF